MNNSEIIPKLLYFALIEMRDQGRIHKNSVVFHLADLFHNVPAKLQRAAKGEISYDEILEEMMDHAKRGGYDSWITNTIAHFENQEHRK